jgi:hypothetical protein
MNPTIRLQIENSDADRDDIREVLNELEKLRCRYPDAYPIATIFDPDALQETLTNLNEEEWAAKQAAMMEDDS